MNCTRDTHLIAMLSTGEYTEEVTTDQLWSSEKMRASVIDAVFDGDLDFLEPDEIGDRDSWVPVAVPVFRFVEPDGSMDYGSRVVGGLEELVAGDAAPVDIFVATSLDVSSDLRRSPPASAAPQPSERELKKRLVNQARRCSLYLASLLSGKARWSLHEVFSLGVRLREAPQELRATLAALSNEPYRAHLNLPLACLEGVRGADLAPLAFFGALLISPEEELSVHPSLMQALQDVLWIKEPLRSYVQRVNELVLAYLGNTPPTQQVD